MKTNIINFHEEGFIIDTEILASLWLHKFTEEHKFPEDIGAMTPDEFMSAAKHGTLPEDYRDLTDVDSLLKDRRLMKLTDFYGTVAAEPAEGDTIAWLRPNSESNEMQEVQDILGDLYLPEDFDWAGHIVRIDGTVYA